MGSQAEFLTLFLKHQVEVRAFLGALVRDPHARDDLFQEVALVLWGEFDRYDHGRSFGAWARGVAAKKVLQRWEREARRPVPFSPEAIQALLDGYERTEAAASLRAEALRHCLERLPDRSRRLLELRYDESLKLAQIAERLRATLDAVHKALCRLRTRLHECVERRLAAARREG
jgi:RNA polymerase sigma-70 factor (ECF subfamily)